MISILKQPPQDAEAALVVIYNRLETELGHEAEAAGVTIAV